MVVEQFFHRADSDAVDRDPLFRSPADEAFEIREERTLGTEVRTGHEDEHHPHHTERLVRHTALQKGDAGGDTGETDDPPQDGAERAARRDGLHFTPFPARY